MWPFVPRATTGIVYITEDTQCYYHANNNNNSPKQQNNPNHRSDLGEIGQKVTLNGLGLLQMRKSVVVLGSKWGKAFANYQTFFMDIVWKEDRKPSTYKRIRSTILKLEGRDGQIYWNRQREINTYVLKNEPVIFSANSAHTYLSFRN